MTTRAADRSSADRSPEERSTGERASADHPLDDRPSNGRPSGVRLSARRSRTAPPPSTSGQPGVGRLAADRPDSGRPDSSRPDSARPAPAAETAAPAPAPAPDDAPDREAVGTALAGLPRVVDLLAARAEEHDRDATFPYQGIEAVHEAGLLTLTVSRTYGGPGGTLADTVRVLSQLGRGDASVAVVTAFTPVSGTPSRVAAPTGRRPGTGGCSPSPGAAPHWSTRCGRSPARSRASCRRRSPGGTATAGC